MIQNVIKFSILSFCLILLSTQAVFAQTSFDASAGGSIRPGYDSRTCDSTIEGAIRYNSASITPAATDYVHRWTMDETTGTTVADSAGSSNGTWQGSANVVSTTGIVGTALQFDGTNHYITIPDAASLEAQNNMTISMWVQFDASGLGSYQNLLYKDHSAAPWYGWELSMSSTNYPYIGLVDTLSTYYDAGGSLIYEGQWYHLVTTVSGGNTMSFFVNGTRNESWNDGTISNPLFTGSDGALSIGADPSSGGNKFTGVIDDIRIYDRALSSSEIFDLFLEGLNGGDGGSGCTEYCNGSTWVCPNSGAAAGGGGSGGGNGYFVMSNSTYSGNFGGLSGADSTCLTDLQTNNWKGKADAGTLTAARVKAFLCDSATCNNLEPDTFYLFAVSGDTSLGGSAFTTDSSGLGPNNPADWSDSAIFGGSGTYYWTNRSAGSSELWGSTPGANSCSDWSDGTFSFQGLSGFTNNINSARWSSGPYNCSLVRPLICFVNP